MKIINQSISAIFACLLLTTVKSFAVDELKISVQGQNAILQWKSTNTETYIVQYADNLNPPVLWTTLTDLYPASVSGNITYFTNFNSVIYPPLVLGDGDGDGDITPPAARASGELMAVPNNGQGDAAPLAIYPIGADLSNFTIVDSLTGESVSGKNYVIRERLPNGGAQPMDDIESTNQNAAFYRVVRDGAWIVGLTNGAVLSGVVTLPVELGNASGTLETLCITESNSPIEDSIQVPPDFTPLATKLDTTLMPNGVHYISAYASWSDTNGGRWEANSPTISITTSNEITFEHYMRGFGEIGNTVLINATSAHPSTDWILSVYDDHTNYLGYFSGHTDNGDIGVYWDYSGTPYTNSQFFSFEIETDYVDPPVPKTYKQNDPWIDKGAWAMGCQHAFDYIPDHESLYGELNGFAEPQASNGGVKPPVDVDGNVYAIHFDDGAEVSTWTTFKNAVFDPATRNLVYFGHGGGIGLGYNPYDTNVSLLCTEIQARLHTFPLGQTNRHNFRFVFIDGCSSGTGHLPEAFGIRHEENVDANYYYYASLRYSCFVGWTKDKSVGFLAGAAPNYDHVHFITHINYDMQGGGTISHAIIESRINE